MASKAFKGIADVNSLIRDLERVSWKADSKNNLLPQLDKTNPGLTHVSDALGYLLEGQFGLTPERRTAPNVHCLKQERQQERRTTRRSSRWVGCGRLAFDLVSALSVAIDHLDFHAHLFAVAGKH